jgi:hypothetical protein
MLVTQDPKRSFSLLRCNDPTGGQAQRESRSFARLARQRHVAAHQAGELARESKAKAGAAITSRGQGIGLSKFLEQLRLLFRRHTNACVCNRKLDPLASIHYLTHPQRDLTLLGKLAGIAQQVQQNLLEPHGIGGQRPDAIRALDHQTVPVLLGELTRGADHLIDQARQVHRLIIEFELAGLDLREVQDLVD